MWIICARRKQYPIGGWLLFYFWQIFSGTVLTIFIVLVLGYKNYVPEIYGQSDPYGLFLFSTVPSIVLLLVHATVALMLLCTRSWRVLNILRAVTVVQLCFEYTGLAIDAAHFPDNVMMDLIMSVIPLTLWTSYLFFSIRIQRVFKYDNWEKLPPPSFVGLT